jgi:hypothetical protein
LPNTAIAPNAAAEATQRRVPEERTDRIVAARRISSDSDS